MCPGFIRSPAGDSRQELTRNGGWEGGLWRGRVALCGALDFACAKVLNETTIEDMETSGSETTHNQTEEDGGKPCLHQFSQLRGGVLAGASVGQFGSIGGQLDAGS